VLKEFYQVLEKEDAVPRASIAIQTFGDFLGFNPHTHILISDSCFYGEGTFKVAPKFRLKVLTLRWRLSKNVHLLRYTHPCPVKLRGALFVSSK
jgi:hypothetical protein